MKKGIPGEQKVSDPTRLERCSMKCMDVHQTDGIDTRWLWHASLEVRLKLAKVEITEISSQSQNNQSCKGKRADSLDKKDALACFEVQLWSPQA